MRFFSVLPALNLISSALAISITEPTSSTTWDFSTPQTIKFTSSPNDPSYVSIILLNKSTNYQIKIADNVKTASGEYTTQPNPSVPNGSGYEIQIIDSSGTLATSQGFTVEKGASSSSSSSSSLASSTSTGTSASSTSEASTSVTSTSGSSAALSSTSAASSTTTTASSSSTASTSAGTTLTTTTGTFSSTGRAGSSSTSVPAADAAASIGVSKGAAAFAGMIGLALLFV
ncbi:hypothetical protein VTN96DRAFT_4422 [Rasamsonia emersonii]